MNALSKQKRAIRRMMRKPRSLKLRGYAARLIELNEYFTVFPGENISDCFYVTELNKILLNSTPNICINQACIQGFDCEYITFKAAVNMFERMGI